MKQINDYPDGWVKANDIAKLYNMSLKKLNELFTQEIVLTIQSVIENSKLDFAHKLLDETNPRIYFYFVMAGIR